MNYPIDRIAEFVINTDLKNEQIYKQRGQTNKIKRMQQNFYGKVGELFVDDYFKAGQSEYILEDTGMGKFRSDLVYKGKGFSIKSQDDVSGKAYGYNRFVFGTNDKLISDIYVGVIVSYKSTASPYFDYWVKSISDISCKFSFVCNRATLNLDVWAAPESYLKNKKVLVVDKIPLDRRIDLSPKFPRPS